VIGFGASAESQEASLHSPTDVRGRGILATIFILFLISGMTGLAYEIIWTRLLIRIFGATTFAVTTVLASYMAGLALGSYLFGRMIDRGGRPVRIYGILELGIGVFALAFPLILALFNPVYSRLYPVLEGRFYLMTTVRSALCFAILLIPTTLMGGTLPVLSKFVSRDLSHLTRRVGTLYAVNTTGAVAGAIGAGFLLLPALGIRNATWICAAVNIAIFAIALAVGRGEKKHAATPDTARERPEGVEAYRWDRVLLVAFLLTGFCALSVEVVWTRVLTLVIGTTVYAFSIMLGTFLLGLALGSWAFARIGQRTGRPGKVLGVLVACIGVSVFLSSFAFGRLPLLYMSYYDHVQPDWGAFIWIQFLLCFLIMLVPAFLMGGVFPLVARIFARDLSRVGSEIGTAYAFNTIGSIIGSVAGSYLFLRYLDIETALIVLFWIYLGVSVLLLFSVGGVKRLRLRAVAAIGITCLAGLLIFVSPRWDKVLMTTGVYRFSGIYQTVSGLRQALREREILFYNEGPGATVSVMRYENELSLVIDGKPDASTGPSDMVLQVLLAHLPLILHPDPDTVLVIGLGSGVTLGSVERHDVEAVDCVELLENVVEAAAYFDKHTYDCLSDPRLNLILGDARNHMFLTDRHYDAIISEPTNPWISGVGDLFTVEFFEMAKRRLKPGGLMCCWFHTYHMGEEDIKAIFKTFTSVFPHSSFWMADDLDIILLGSSDPLAFGSHLYRRYEKGAVASDLRRIMFDDLVDVLSAFVTGSEGLRAFVKDTAIVNSDDNMFLEFSAARKFAADVPERHLSNMLSLMGVPPVADLGMEVLQKVGQQMEGRKTAMRGTLAKYAGRTHEALNLYDAAYAFAPSDPYVLSQYVSNHLDAGDAFVDAGDFREAMTHYTKAVVDPDFPDMGAGYHGLGVCYLALGNLGEAFQNFRHSLSKNPYNVAAHYAVGKLWLEFGEMNPAMVAFRRVLDIDPLHADAASQLARTYLEMERDMPEAVELAEQAAKTRGRVGDYTTLAWAYQKTGELKKARKALDTALGMSPDDTEALYRMATVSLEQGDRTEADRLLRKIVRLGRKDTYTTEARAKLNELQSR
jgi:spermidine synthase